MQTDSMFVLPLVKMNVFFFYCKSMYIYTLEGTSEKKYGKMILTTTLVNFIETAQRMEDEIWIHGYMIRNILMQ